jgi:GT2 family glycosyltransferase
MTRPTIVIPVHNQAGLTRQCLDDLLASRDCAGVEILVVDDGSTDVTPAVLESFGDRIRVLRTGRNLGFAAACNLGVEEASSELVVLLNNDVRPVTGWLAALVDYGAGHPEAAAIGAKLLFGNDTVQHAGVVIGQDRNPHHLYAGFPAGHPAVCRSRRFQIVTAACMLVRRSVFLGHTGFDTAFVNGHEDVDLCLRLNRTGHQVHLCAGSVLYHLESASRDLHSEAVRANGRLYRERWAAEVVPDDLGYYLEDGLLAISYADGFPLALTVAPELATASQAGDAALEKLLRERSAQVFELLRESARLTVALGEVELSDQLRTHLAAPGRGAADGPGEHRNQLTQDQHLEAALWQLQKALADRKRGPSPSRWLEYRGQVQQVRETVCRVTPPGAAVAVVSRGDERLVDLPARRGEHLPQDGSGRFAGYYPGDGAAAVRCLEELRSRGVGYLAIPPTSRWWLDHYPELADHLGQVATPLVPENSQALVFALEPSASTEGGSL